MKFKRKPLIFEVEQYNDNSILEFAKDNSSFDCLGRLKVNTHEGLVTCVKGDYVVKDIHENYSVVRQQFFDEEYFNVNESLTNLADIVVYVEQIRKEITEEVEPFVTSTVYNKLGNSMTKLLKMLEMYDSQHECEFLSEKLEENMEV